jgi:hypothetical protein
MVVKFIQCVSRKPEVSIQDFRRHWKAYQAKATELARLLNAVGLVFSTTLAVDENLQVMLRRGTAEPFDGIAEFRISNAPRMIEKLEGEQARRLWQELQNMQSEFMDLENSRFFFASEEVVLRR